MRVLMSCECSGEVRRAFRLHGVDAWSCDLEPAEDESEYHIQGDVLSVLHERWDMVIAFPPCTHLASSGARWFKQKQADGRQQAGIEFFLAHTRLSHVPFVCIENPVGIMSTKYRKPDQIIQPWQFGHGETKATCLWFKGLCELSPTNIVPGREARVHKMAPGPNRSRERSRTYTGIAEAMANQWTPIVRTYLCLTDQLAKRE